MAYVHSLVKTERNGKRGWCAPVEFGEDAPHYVSFVVPLDAHGDFFPQYDCETVTGVRDDKRLDTHVLHRRGEESFVLRVANRDLWFVARAVPKDDRRLPYVGKLGHTDFDLKFAEIEPERPETLDKLYDEANFFVIGCEPFAHYSGIDAPAKH